MRSQKSSAAVWANDLYSASVEERATVGCFLTHRETGAGPKKTH